MLRIQNKSVFFVLKFLHNLVFKHKKQCCGSRRGLFRIPDLGFRFPNPYFLELSDKFLGKKFYNSLETGPICFLQHKKKKKLLILWSLGYKKGMTINYFSPLSFDEVFGSGIWDPGWVKNTDKKAAFPQLRVLATNKVRNKFAGFGPDPLVEGTDPRIRIRTKMSRINKTAYSYS
jgi:hypothetical protein